MSSFRDPALLRSDVDVPAGTNQNHQTHLVELFQQLETIVGHCATLLMVPAARYVCCFCLSNIVRRVVRPHFFHMFGQQSSLDLEVAAPRKSVEPGHVLVVHELDEHATM